MIPPTAPTLPAGHPLAQLPTHPLAEESGRVMMPGYIPQPIPEIPASAAPPSAPAPQFDHSAALRQLATLDAFGKATDEARASGGPTAGLMALMKKPLQVGPFTLQPISLATYWFLQTIGSPFVTGAVPKDEDLAKTLLAFVSAEEAENYLTFTPDKVLVDQVKLQRDAFKLASALDGAGIGQATNWIISQIGGLASLFPAGKEAENFPIAGETGTSPPPETSPTQAPQDGSLS